VGQNFLFIAATAGAWAFCSGKSLRASFRRASIRPSCGANLYKMAVKSLPIVAVTALFTGAIMVIQAAPIVKRYGPKVYLVGEPGLEPCVRSPRC